MTALPIVRELWPTRFERELAPPSTGPMRMPLRSVTRPKLFVLQLATRLEFGLRVVSG